MTAPKGQPCLVEIGCTFENIHKAFSCDISTYFKSKSPLTKTYCTTGIFRAQVEQSDALSEFDKSVTMRFTRVAHCSPAVVLLRIVGKYFLNRARHSAIRVAQCIAKIAPGGMRWGQSQRQDLKSPWLCKGFHSTHDNYSTTGWKIMPQGYKCDRNTFIGHYLFPKWHSIQRTGMARQLSQYWVLVKILFSLTSSCVACCGIFWVAKHNSI